MPIIVIQPIKRLHVYYNFSTTVDKALPLIDVSIIAKKYRHIFTPESRFRFYLSRIFNEENNVVNEPRRFAFAHVIYAEKYREQAVSGYEQAEGFYMDMYGLTNELSIPDGYLAEVLIISLIIPQMGERIIFPYETRAYAVKDIEPKISERIESLRKIGAVSQSSNLLAKLGLSEIAEDLSVGYSKFDGGDYDGAIKAYRKVVEGYKNYLGQKSEEEGKKTYNKLIDGMENRTEKIVEFLSKTYSLLSNFGEHYGTHAYDEEGVFTHKLVEDLTEYLTKKLESKK